MASDLTHERLLELLTYNRFTGIFEWRVNRRGTVHKGDIAGCLASDGYVNIQVDGVRHPAHVLVWLYVHGRWPENEIDHKDNVRHHNWLDNLRDATVAMNRQNLKQAIATNKHSGLLGSHYHADHEPTPWRACIVVKSRRKHLGYFKTPEAAHAAYIAAKRQLHEGNML